MPKVPQYQESQHLGAMPDARVSVDGRALASALGGETWRTVVQAGRQMRATGDQVGGIALDMMREHNETVAMDRLNQAEAAILDMQTEQGQRYGSNALTSQDGKTVGVSDTLRAGLDKVRGELIQGMNPAQKKLFDDVFVRRGQSVMRWGTGYEAQQREVHTSSVEDGRLAVEAQRALANYGDREQVGAALGNALFTVERRGKRLGLAPEAVEAQRLEVSHKLLLPVFEAMIDKGELGQARQYLREFESDLGAGEVARVEARIQVRADVLAAKAEAQRKKAEEARLDSFSAGIWEDTKGLPWEKRQEEAINLIAARTEDPTERRKLLERFDYDVKFQKMGEEAAENRQVRTLVEGARKAGLLPTQFAEQLNGNQDVSVKVASLAFETFLGKIKETSANRAALVELRDEIDRRKRDGNPTSDDEIEAWGLNHRMTNEQIKSGYSYRDGGGKMGNITASDLTKQWKALGGPKLPKDVDIYRLVEDRVPDGKNVIHVDLETIMSNLIMSGEIKGGGWGYGKDMRGYEAYLNGSLDTWLPDNLSRQEREEGTKFLTAKGWPVTDELLRVYAKEARGIPHNGISSLAAWPDFTEVQAVAPQVTVDTSLRSPPSVDSPEPSDATLEQAQTVIRPTTGTAYNTPPTRATGAENIRSAVISETRKRWDAIADTPFSLPDALGSLPKNASDEQYNYVVVFGELPSKDFSANDMKRAVQQQIAQDLDKSIFDSHYVHQRRVRRLEYLKQNLRGDIRHPVTGVRCKDWKL